MEKQETKTVDVQGTETATKRKENPLRIIKGFKDYVTKIEAENLLPAKEVKELKLLHQKMVQLYMGEPLL